MDDGFFRKRGLVRDGRSGKYRGYLTYSEDGREKRKTKTFTARKRESQRLYDEWFQQMNGDAAGATPSGDMTVGRCVQLYIERRRRAGSCKPTTLDGYEYHREKRIDPLIGDVRLGDLDAYIVQSWMDETSEGLSPATARGAWRLLRAALNEASEDSGLPNLLMVTSHRYQMKPDDGKGPNPLTEDSKERLVAYLDSSACEPVDVAAALALRMGLRRGEVCGLEWDCVDLEGGNLKTAEDMQGKPALKVERNLTRSGGELHLGSPKSKSSRRALRIPGKMLRMLQTRRERMEAECRAAGIEWTDSLFVLGTIDGRWYDPNTLWKHWHILRGELGLEGIEEEPTFHDLRDTYASYLLRDGHKSMETVAHLLGHAKPSTTLDMYAASIPGERSDAADAADEIF